MDWQCPHHPNNYKHLGRMKADQAKPKSKNGTTKISEAILAKQKAVELAKTIPNSARPQREPRTPASAYAREVEMTGDTETTIIDE